LVTSNDVATSQSFKLQKINWLYLLMCFEVCFLFLV